MPQDNTSEELTTGTRLQAGKYIIERNIRYNFARSHLKNLPPIKN